MTTDEVPIDKDPLQKSVPQVISFRKKISFFDRNDIVALP